MPNRPSHRAITQAVGRVLAEFRDPALKASTVHRPWGRVEGHRTPTGLAVRVHLARE